MDRHPQSAARARRQIRDRADETERALATVWLAVADLSDVQRLTVLVAALQEANERHEAARRAA